LRLGVSTALLAAGALLIMAETAVGIAWAMVVIALALATVRPPSRREQPAGDRRNARGKS
jgi:hypothetical protein